MGATVTPHGLAKSGGAGGRSDEAVPTDRGALASSTLLGARRSTTLPAVLRSSRARTLALLVSLTPGCGGPPPKAAPQPAPPASASSAASAASAAPKPPAPPPDLSEVAEPSGVAVLATASRAADLLTLADELGRGRLRDASLESLVDGEAPGFAVLAVETEGFHVGAQSWALSLPLRSLADARTRAEREGAVTDLPNGAFEVAGAGPTDRRCAVGPAAGTAPARLVCASSGRALSDLLPFLTRTLPRRTPTDAGLVSVEVRASATMDKLAGALRIGGPTLRLRLRERMGRALFAEGPALEAATDAFFDDALALAKDLDVLRVRIDRAADGHTLALTADARFRTKVAKSTRALLQPGARSGPPAAFAKLPEATVVGGWFSGPGPALLAAERSVVAGLGASLTGARDIERRDPRAPTPGEVEKASREIMEAFPFPTGPTAFAGTSDGVLVIGTFTAAEVAKWRAKAKAVATKARIGFVDGKNRVLFHNFGRARAVESVATPDGVFLMTAPPGHEAKLDLLRRELESGRTAAVPTFAKEADTGFFAPALGTVWLTADGDRAIVHVESPPAALGRLF